MFERFTREARIAVVFAQEEARRLQHNRIGTEHLLLALLHHPETVSAQVLAGFGVTHEAANASVVRYVGSGDIDADALGAIGIDLDVVREKVEAVFGAGALDQPASGRRRPIAGHIPFSPRAKKTLELSLREAILLKDRHIRDAHILLGIVREGEGLAMRVLADAGVEGETLRRRLRERLGGT
jgi:ATP-dependent Clp protease ATP-binding subunit ClpA